jgi:hypothetical protein
MSTEKTEMIEKPKVAWILEDQTHPGPDGKYDWSACGVTFDEEVAKDWIKPKKNRLPRVASRVEVKY